jgi:hypothetical protein
VTTTRHQPSSSFAATLTAIEAFAIVVFVVGFSIVTILSVHRPEVSHPVDHAVDVQVQRYMAWTPSGSAPNPCFAVAAVSSDDMQKLQHDGRFRLTATGTVQLTSVVAQQSVFKSFFNVFETGLGGNPGCSQRMYVIRDQNQAIPPEYISAIIS